VSVPLTIKRSLRERSAHNSVFFCDFVASVSGTLTIAFVDKIAEFLIFKIIKHMQIIYEDSKNLEKHGILTKFIRIVSVPLLNNLPAGFIQGIMKSTSRDAAATVNYAGSTHALEVMYTRHSRKLFSRGILQGLADLFWHHCISQPKALRNRLKIVEKTLEEEFLRIMSHKNKEVISLLNVGGGSSRAIIHSVDRLLRKSDGAQHRVEVINIDKSQKAIDLGKEIAEEFKLRHIFKWINDDARNIKLHVPDKTIDIAEMVGLLDYFSEEKGVEVIEQIHAALEDDGLLIIANVYPNNEVPFIYKAGWPKMYYREAKDIDRILRKSGFKESIIIFEPLKCHIIATARK
jgi:hypothetical protein